jgi:hypothetical protein
VVEQVTATKVFQVNGYPLLFFASTPLLFFLEPFFSLCYYCNNLFHIIPFSVPSKLFLKTIYSSLACAFCSFFLITAQGKAALAGHLESRLSIFTSSSSSVGVPVFLLQLLLESFLSKGQVVG